MVIFHVVGLGIVILGIIGALLHIVFFSIDNVLEIMGYGKQMKNLELAVLMGEDFKPDIKQEKELVA